MEEETTKNTDRHKLPSCFPPSASHSSPRLIHLMTPDESWRQDLIGTVTTVGQCDRRKTTGSKKGFYSPVGEQSQTHRKLPTSSRPTSLTAALKSRPSIVCISSGCNQPKTSAYRQAAAPRLHPQGVFIQRGRQTNGRYTRGSADGGITPRVRTDQDTVSKSSPTSQNAS